MSISTQEAYTQLKKLENSGQIPIPEPQGTVVVGTIDAKAGTFKFSVPTTVQTTTIPPIQGTGQETNTIINVTCGVIQTNCVDLLLKFDVVNAAQIVVSEQAIPAKAALASVATEVGDVTAFGGSNGITVDGFMTKSNSGGVILVDAGLAASAVLQTPNMSPPVGTFPLTFNIPGHAAVSIRLIIVRPPVLGFGAFTIPALPLAIIYAPPQGALQKNSATYTVAQTFSRSVTTSVTQSTNTKTAQAFTAADLIGKVAGSIAAVAALVGTGGASAGASAGVLGGLLTTLFGSGSSGSGGDSTSSDLKTASSALGLFADILNAVPAPSTSQSNTITSESDQTMTIATTQMATFTTTPGQGPGVGDIFVYFNNMKVVWVSVNGEVGINVLDAGSLVTTSAAELQADLATVNGGGKGQLGLDAASLKLLLGFDPYCVKRNVVAIGAPLVAPPRFTPANQPEIGVNGATANYSEAIDVTTEDKETQTSTQATITDVSASWVAVLFGGDNTNTTTTITFSTTQTTDTKTDLKITNTANFQSTAPNDVLDVLAFNDNTFGTVLYAVKGALVLQGGRVVGNLGANLAESKAAG